MGISLADIHGNPKFFELEVKRPILDDLERALIRLQGAGEPIQPFPLQPKTDLGASSSSRKSPRYELYVIRMAGCRL